MSQASSAVIIPPVFDGYPVKAFFSTKGLSCNRHALGKFLAAPPENIFMPIQKHTDKVVVLDFDRGPKVGDAVITRNKDLFIGVQAADCTPVLIFDKKRLVAAAVHAGWRGTAASIVNKTIETMSMRFSTVPSDIIMAIGPAIRWCCYEVGYEVIEAVVRAVGAGDYYRTKGGKYCLDLAIANRQQAVSSGVPPEQIWLSDECTFCLPEKYHSYRFGKSSTGRQCGIIGIV
jgi:YfiH family protein